jgi:hypothetical protein
MRAERARLEAELAAGGDAATRLRALAAAGGQENGKDAAGVAIKTLVTLTHFVPLLQKAEALHAKAAGGAQQPQHAAQGACRAPRRGRGRACVRAPLPAYTHALTCLRVTFVFAAAAAAAADDAARRAAASGGGLSALSALNARIHGGVA